MANTRDNHRYLLKQAQCKRGNVQGGANPLQSAYALHQSDHTSDHTHTKRNLHKPDRDLKEIRLMSQSLLLNYYGVVRMSATFPRL